MFPLKFNHIGLLGEGSCFSLLELILALDKDLLLYSQNPVLWIKYSTHTASDQDTFLWQLIVEPTGLIMCVTSHTKPSEGSAKSAKSMKIICAIGILSSTMRYG